MYEIFLGHYRYIDVLFHNMKYLTQCTIFSYLVLYRRYMKKSQWREIWSLCIRVRLDLYTYIPIPITYMYILRSLYYITQPRARPWRHTRTNPPVDHFECNVADLHTYIYNIYLTTCSIIICGGPPRRHHSCGTIGKETRVLGDHLVAIQRNDDDDEVL